MLPNLEPEASSLRRRVLTLEEDESGACWPCVDPGGREVVGWDEMLVSEARGLQTGVPVPSVNRNFR